MKLYLLDANVLTTANRDYYSMEMAPVFWEWLLHMAERGHVKMPIETLEEVRDGGGKAKKDALVTWLNRADVYEKLVLHEDADPEIVTSVIVKGYAPDLDETELDEVGRDPFLIAYAVADPDNRVVVSIEVSAPAKKRANRRVQDDPRSPRSWATRLEKADLWKPCRQGAGPGTPGLPLPCTVRTFSCSPTIRRSVCLPLKEKAELRATT